MAYKKNINRKIYWLLGLGILLILVLVFLSLFKVKKDNLVTDKIINTNKDQPTEKSKVSEQTSPVSMMFAGSNRLDIYDVNGNWIKNIYTNNNDDKLMTSARYCQKNNLLAAIYKYSQGNKEVTELSIINLNNNKTTSVEKLSYDSDKPSENDVAIDDILSFTSDCQFIIYQISHQEGYALSRAKIYSLSLNKSISLGELSTAFWSPLEEYLAINRYDENNSINFSLIPKNQILNKIKNSNDVLDIEKYNFSNTGINLNNVNKLEASTFLDENNLILIIAYKGETTLIPQGILDINSNQFTSTNENQLAKSMGIANCKDKNTYLPCGYKIFPISTGDSKLKLLEKNGYMGYMTEHYLIQLAPNEKSKELSIDGWFSGWLY